jgi:transcriptional regulator of heat shock response
MPKKQIIDPSTNLSQRQKSILFAMIKEYCDLGVSLGSKELKDKYQFTFSSATIRNELVQLRDLGYLYQPFLNSSSKPTDKAFKLFINQLIVGLQATSRQQQDLRQRLEIMESQQQNLSREISRLLAVQSGGAAFSLEGDHKHVTGMRNLLDSPSEGKVGDILDFLDNIDHYKQFLLTDGSHPQSSLADTPAEDMQNLITIIGDENPIIPLGRGYAMVATKVYIRDEVTVVGLVTPIQLLAKEKNIALMDALNKLLGKVDNNHRGITSKDL